MLANLTQKISNLEHKDHLIIGAILRKYQTVKLNENKGGIMVNLAMVPDEAIQEIQKYIDYLGTQKTVLHKIESETNEYKQYFQ
jgi:hypothetical protein